MANKMETTIYIIPNMRYLDLTGLLGKVHGKCTGTWYVAPRRVDRGQAGGLPAGSSTTWQLRLLKTLNPEV